MNVNNINIEMKENYVKDSGESLRNFDDDNEYNKINSHLNINEKIQMPNVSKLAMKDDNLANN